MPFFSLPKVKLAFCLAGLLLIAGCSSDEDRLREQVSLLQNQIKGWQAHYRQLYCLKDALDAAQYMDIALGMGLSLPVYKENIALCRQALEKAECPEAEKGPLADILSLHELAAQMWEGRNKGNVSALAGEFATIVYPLWIKFNYPQEALGPELREALEGYDKASGPEADKYLGRIKAALIGPQTLPALGSIANQLLWHEVHNKLNDYKLALLTPPYPTQ